MSPRNPIHDLDPAQRALRLELERLHAAVDAALPGAPRALGPLRLHWPCLGVQLWELPSSALEEAARGLGTAPPTHRRIRVDVGAHHAEADLWLADDGHDRALLVELGPVVGSPHAIATHARHTARAVERTVGLRGG